MNLTSSSMSWRRGGGSDGLFLKALKVWKHDFQIAVSWPKVPVSGSSILLGFQTLDTRVTEYIWNIRNAKFDIRIFDRPNIWIFGRTNIIQWFDIRLNRIFNNSNIFENIRKYLPVRVKFHFLRFTPKNCQFPCGFPQQLWFSSSHNI